MLGFYIIELSDYLEDFPEAKVHELVSFALEVFIADENCVIRIDVWDAIWQLVLQLSCQIAYDTCIYSATLQEMYIS